MSTTRAEILIVGAGVIGLGIADALVRRNLKVLVLERERAGGRASWAGAGMLNCRPHLKHKPGTTDYGDLALASKKLYESWAQRLLEETEIDVGLKRCGALEVFTPERLKEDGADTIEQMLQGCHSRGVPAEKLSAQQAQQLQPGLNSVALESVVYLPDDAQIRTPRLSRALALSVRQREGQIKEGVAVKDVILENGRAVGVEDSSGREYRAEKVIFASGAWSGQFPKLSEVVPEVAKIHPVRGQIVCYQLPQPAPARLITAHEHYLVLRPDGIVLVGSTTEKVGFEAVTTPEGQGLLRAFGASLLPVLERLEPLQGWADLRPGLKGRHPLLGPVPEVENLFIAAGHYRNGLCLAPITAEIIAAQVCGQPTPLEVAYYQPKAGRTNQQGQSLSS